MIEQLERLTTDVRASARARGDLMRLFFGFAIIVHEHPSGLRPTYDTPLVPIVVLLALALVLRPTSRRIFGAMLAAVLIDAVWRLPVVTNHGMALALISAALLGGVTADVLRRRHDVWERLDAAFVGVGAVSLVCIFLAAAFQKANAGFFDPAVSCAVDHLDALFEKSIVLGGVDAPVTIDRITIWVTWLTELGIGALLIARRTRIWGLALAAAFGIVMAVNSFAPFSVVSFALYLAFVPDAAIAEIERMRRADLRVSGLFRLVSLAAVGLVVVGGLLEITGNQLGGGQITTLLYLATIVPMIVVFAVATWRTRTERTSRVTSHRSHVVAVAGVTALLLVTNTAMPFVGVRTGATFSMFSNLRAEPSAGYWNHYLVPEAVALDSNGAWLEVLGPDSAVPPVLEGRPGQFHHELEVRRAVSEQCANVDGLSVRYRAIDADGVRGPVVTLDDACTTEFGQPLSLVERKLRWYRPIAEPNLCTL